MDKSCICTNTMSDIIRKQREQNINCKLLSTDTEKNFNFPSTNNSSDVIYKKRDKVIYCCCGWIGTTNCCTTKSTNCCPSN